MKTFEQLGINPNKQYKELRGWRRRHKELNDLYVRLRHGAKQPTAPSFDYCKFYSNKSGVSLSTDQMSIQMDISFWNKFDVKLFMDTFWRTIDNMISKGTLADRASVMIVDVSQGGKRFLDITHAFSAEYVVATPNKQLLEALGQATEFIRAVRIASDLSGVMSSSYISPAETGVIDFDPNCQYHIVGTDLYLSMDTLILASSEDLVILEMVTEVMTKWPHRYVDIQIVTRK